MSLIDFIRETGGILGSAGGFLGTASTGVTGYFFKRFQDTEKEAKEALALGKKNETELARIDKLIKDIDDTHKRVSNDRISTSTETSDVSRRLEELRGEILRERGARHALQKEFGEYVRGEAESWRELHRSLGQIEGRLETVLSTGK